MVYYAVFTLLLQILSMDESAAVGCISKQWTGFVREAFTDADNFGIKFPLDLDVKMKAVLLGACFLIVSILFVLFMTSNWFVMLGFRLCIC